MENINQNFNYEEWEKNILFVKVPIGQIDREVVFDDKPVSTIEPHFKKIISQGIRIDDSKNKIKDLVIAGYTRKKDFVKELFEKWDSIQMMEDLRQNAGAFMFIDAPFTHVEKGFKYIAGLLFYNENGIIYLFSFYASPAKIYKSYLKRLSPEANPLPPSIQNIRAEVLSILTRAIIPRLKNAKK
jgi:hypothetical protein